MSTDPTSERTGFYVRIPWREGAATNDLSKMVGVEIKPGTPLSESLAAVQLLGMDEGVIKQLSTPLALLKAREVTTNPSTPPGPSPEVQREAAKRIFRLHTGATLPVLRGE